MCLEISWHIAYRWLSTLAGLPRNMLVNRRFKIIENMLTANFVFYRKIKLVNGMERTMGATGTLSGWHLNTDTDKKFFDWIFSGCGDPVALTQPPFRNTFLKWWLARRKKSQPFSPLIVLYSRWITAEWSFLFEEQSKHDYQLNLPLNQFRGERNPNNCWNGGNEGNCFVVFFNFQESKCRAGYCQSRTQRMRNKRRKNKTVSKTMKALIKLYWWELNWIVNDFFALFFQNRLKRTIEHSRNANGML